MPLKFDLVQAINLAIYLVATMAAVYAGGVRAYFGIMGAIADFRKDMEHMKETNEEAHQRLEDGHKDHEIRIRVLEKSGG